jgi:hypothetical protein
MAVVEERRHLPALKQVLKLYTVRTKGGEEDGGVLEHGLWLSVPLHVLLSFRISCFLPCPLRRQSRAPAFNPALPLVLPS